MFPSNHIPSFARLTLDNGDQEAPVIIRLDNIISLTPVRKEVPVEQDAPGLSGGELWNAVEEAYKRCRESCSDEEGNELLRWMTGEDCSHEGRWRGTYIMLKGDTRPLKVKEDIGVVVSLTGTMSRDIVGRRECLNE